NPGEQRHTSQSLHTSFGPAPDLCRSRTQPSQSGLRRNKTTDRPNQRSPQHGRLSDDSGINIRIERCAEADRVVAEVAEARVEPTINPEPCRAMPWAGSCKPGDEVDST